MKRITAYLLVSIVLLGMSIPEVSAQKHKIIFDCDLGDDIDDAFALAMILASDDFEVLGICMDWGNTEDRAQLACRMLYETGREDIPVFIGRKTSDNNVVQHAWGIGFDKLKPQKKSAADFIVETLNKYPGEVNLITVGPVPNMMDVVKKDKSALSKAKHIYAMFGSFYMGYDLGPRINAEWNVRADVEASKMYTANVNNITYAGTDVTTFVKWDEEKRLKLMMRNTPLTDAITALTVLWQHKTLRETPTLFDCVAIGMLLWPDLFDTRPAFVKVIDGGYTIIDESKEPNSQVGLQIKTEEFLKRLMDLYMNQNLVRRE
ncbi:MAG: nucleoside hydrolase [Cyclobacteriaceae bacterium]|nr:nucleoside hydrolase [Cyclobacteriaceae bacterium]